MKYSLLLIFCAAAWSQTRQHTEATIVLHLNAAPNVVFPLFGPVRETEWVKGWDPHILYPADRSQIPGAVFTEGDAVWLLTTYDLKNLRMAYAFFEPGLSANQIEIVVKSAPGGKSEASVTYKRTALSEAGDRQVTEFAQHFPGHRAHWEETINARLKELAK